MNTDIFRIYFFIHNFFSTKFHIYLKIVGWGLFIFKEIANVSLGNYSRKKDGKNIIFYSAFFQ
jgi:hypothetical protein